MHSTKPLFKNENVGIYFHGGAYVSGSPKAYRRLVGNLAASSGLRMISIKYRLAPAHPFPAQLHDALIFFTFLLNQGFRPENIILMGDSAGGNLCLSLHQLLRSLNYPSIRGIVLLSPWVDFIPTRPSYKSNAHLDLCYIGNIHNPNALARLFYAPGRKYSTALLEELHHPLISPINADFANLPPVLIQCGELETFFDDIEELYKRIAAKNPGREDNIIYECYQGMYHVFHLFVNTPSAHAAVSSIGEFVKRL
ncbi:alpha/beta-hydrolase [Martensiomyces pterosporus]|nr:alpha/beta-hydrolase [Martensiomyces pterosporus]